MPQLIINALRLDSIQPPKKSKINSFLTNWKAKSLGRTTMNLDELLGWCEENDSAIDLDEPYVIAYQINTENKPSFRMCISTERLIRQMRFATHLCADGTYKLTHNNYPLIIPGSTDLAKQFHPFGLALCMNEEKSDFAFVFER